MPLLIETLNSLAKQTEIPDEIILSDNFSTDETQNTLKEFASTFKNTKYVRSPRYLEVGPSFNFAISHSNCDWVFFLHSDDVLSKHAIKIIRREIEHAKIFTGVISFKAEIISEKSNLKRAAFSIGRRRYEFGNQFILNIDANKKDLNTKFQLGKLVRKSVILVMEALLNDPLLNKAAVVIRTGMDKMRIGNFGR